MGDLFSSFALLGLSFLTPAQATYSGGFVLSESISPETVLAQKTMNLRTRHPDKWVNEVFSDNILLNLHYFKGDVDSLKDNGKINWEKALVPFEFTMTLNPGQTFAYHRNLLPEFKDKNVITGKSRFWFDEGYKSDGYLVGDGVCHLATFFNWVAKTARPPSPGGEATGEQAGLEVVSYVNHDFLPVPEIPKEFGTSIFYSPDGARGSARQNLYITNNFSYPVEFQISAGDGRVEIKIVALL